ncbi:MULTISPECIES: ABC transporter permease [unclassified Roseobacter]|jgi:glycine betaine/proline transport system permease protein|uniref:ABC transporter permease n=1 Tax=unclassified Roseobacter TaxID=196798 RepID=UPI00236F384A|nr:ABC transporter permease subunit [Paracoccaceae bacterium]
MAYDWIFSALGMTDACKTDSGPLLSLSSLRNEAPNPWDLPFPSLDTLNEACAAFPKTRDFTAALEDGFLYIRPALRTILDPLTQPLSWALDGALTLFVEMPWWILVPLLILVAKLLSNSYKVASIVATSFLFLLFVDYYEFAIQTLSIIFVCTVLCVAFGVPLGIAMSRSDRFQNAIIPILDMLQTLPTFVYLIPLIFLFNITEPKLYGLAIILYAIVPVVRLTNLGIRLVDRDVMEAVTAFGLTDRQKLYRVQIPLALPNIMAGVNQTIMMSLAMVVIASLVSAPGLGTLVLDGINNLRLGVGFLAGFGIVLIAIMLDRVSKAALARIDKSNKS